MRWTDYRLGQAHEISAIVKELEPYHPLTLRQIHYQAVSRGLRENTRSAYNDLSKLLKQMRLDGYLPWEVVEDRTRKTGDKRGYTDAGEYMGLVADAVTDYSRCLVQGQENYVEVWVEKDALRHLFEQVTWPLCIRLTVTRGFSSITLVKDYYGRLLQALDAGQRPVLLFFSDFDPSGTEMLESIEKNLRSIGLRDIPFGADPPLPEMIRPALTLEQIEEYDLANNPDALKATDTRAKRFIQEHGRYSVELDAHHPEDLQEIIRESIEQYVDMDFVRQQQEIEARERDKLERVRVDIEAVLRTHGLQI